MGFLALQSADIVTNAKGGIRLMTVISPRQPNNIVNSLVKPAMNEIRTTASAATDIELDKSLVQQTIDSDPVESLYLGQHEQGIKKGRFIECKNIFGEVVREAGGSSPLKYMPQLA